MDTGRTTTTTIDTSKATETSRTTTPTTTTTFETSTQVFERITASAAGTIFDTEVASADAYNASFWTVCKKGNRGRTANSYRRPSGLF